MNASSPLVHPASAPEVRNVNNPVRPTKLTTRPAAPMQASTVRLKPTKQTRHRIPAPQRIRVMQKYALGQNQTAIARDENLNRETVAKIVRSAEMDAYVEEKRELWRGLCDPAIEVIRQKLKEGDKEVALRILESNGVIPASGATFNYNIQTAANPNQDERGRNLRACFADVMMERARIFKTPMPELNEIANERGIKLDFPLNAPEVAEEDEG
jgi:hypothetical protein